MRWNLKAIEKRRDKLYLEVFSQAVTREIDGYHLARIVAETHARLPVGIERTVLFDSLSDLAGKVMSSPLALSTAWRIAGNVERLQAGKAVPPFVFPREDETVPLQILKCVPGRDNKKRLGYTYTLRVLGGTPAAHTVTVFWRMKQIKHVARTIGFSAPFGDFPFSKPVQLVGLWLLGVISAVKSINGIVFSETNGTSGIIKWNRDTVLRLRLRVDKKCPYNWTHPCHNCAIGYASCIAATHRQNYTTQECHGCGKIEVFDPDSIYPELCIKCNYQQLCGKQ